MQAILSKLWLWFWHLIPCNPILVRVVQGASRRTRHLWLRFGYLSILLMVVLISLTSNVSGGGSLADLAKGASTTFMWASIAQLALMCFLAPVFTAGAITQEKDAQTYNILLTTPLSNAQIVFGSLLSRLYFVIMLLVAGLPIFFMTMVYGGVTAGQIARSFAIAAATAVLTGSLAIAISMIRVGTRRTIFSFYLVIGIYILGVYGLGSQMTGTWIDAAPANIAGQKMSWLAPFHPFLALEVALNQVEAPDLGMVADAGWPWKYFLAYPQTTYVTLTIVLSFALTVLSMFFVRSGAKEGESTFLSAIAARFGRTPASERTRTPRNVWNNPVAWREAATRGSGLSNTVARYAIFIVGVLGAAVLLYYYARGKHAFDAATTREWLAGIVSIEFGVVLVVAVNMAASAMTKEKESNTMDLLLTTPLTSKYIVWGKLRGLVSSTVPLIAVPVISVLIFAVFDLFKSDKVKVAYIESAFELAALMIVFVALACIWGLRTSLNSKKTVRAVMVSLGSSILILLAVTALWTQIVDAFGASGAGLAPFTPFTAIGAICNPAILFDSPQDLAAHIRTVRGAGMIGTVIAVGIFSLIVTAIYKGIVRSFDMTLRKQTAG
jgi:ABC-type transport system involved in multi-copper enzyme maturation permease subunit